MDLTQRKLNKTEWDNIEIPTESEELEILRLIIKGYHNVNESYNTTLTILGYLKTKDTKPDIMDLYIYKIYLQSTIERLCKMYKLTKPEAKLKNIEKKIKKADLFRIQNMETQMKSQKNELFEFVILEIIENLLKKYTDKQMWYKEYYSLTILTTYSIEQINSQCLYFINYIKNYFQDKIEILDIFKNSSELIEKNNYLLKYEDKQLYDHQKKIFTICKLKQPKLVLYTAPTGTGKTLSPLGLSESHKVIFVCAARHVGLALAKAAISVEKKVAFAFGCNDADDIRLHYFSAKEYTKNYKSGGIFRVDNTVGDKVEIMICDIKSYLIAMYYMKSFNSIDNLITYWDEPTITMDYENHEVHDIIHKNWKENIIPTVVLSSATLPSTEDLHSVIMDFKNKFENADMFTISSYECKKSIPLINKDCYVEMPHYLSKSYDELMIMIDHCNKYKTLLRHIDLSEAIKFIMYINKEKLLTKKQYYIEKYFETISDISMENIKLYYLNIMKLLNKEDWNRIYDYFHENRRKKYKSNIYITTKDAYTLTDGPTIFLADNIENVAKLCSQTSKIPSKVITDINEAIDYNNIINKKIDTLEKTLEDSMKKHEEKNKEKEFKMTNEMRRLSQQIQELRNQVKIIELNELFVPNTREHLKKWHPKYNKLENKPFTSNISNDIIEDIMLINDIDDSWKLLLMMGIGVFTTYKSIKYTEIMKKLAYNHQLYLVIASTDYIYGTNYQFCHGYISKDLENMTQEKCIQALGRVGRNKLQFDYSWRFRDDKLISKLFHECSQKTEIKNMNKLFNSDDE